MCGIAGIISKSDSANYYKALEIMLNVQNHRGPDEKNIYATNKIFIGHNRLSIIDIKGGQQPMISSKKETLISFNGEIYGFKVIREKIKYDFKTNSDTELIIALYEQNGIDFLKKLPGMFAFSIWDFKKEKLILARDRFGEKPLYYALGKGGEFIYASEIKAIIKSGLVDIELSIDAIGEYLQNLNVQNDSIFKNIKKLNPGCYLEYSKGIINISNFYHYPKTNFDLTYDEALHNFGTIFNNSLKNQLISDVPLGILLSGGLDSSFITAKGISLNSDLKTFTFNFSEDQNQDTYYSNLLIENKKINNISLSDNGIKISEMLLKMNEIFDEPFADSSNIPTYLITKEARNHVKVLVGGDGADELFGGYDWRYMPYQDLKKDSNYLKYIFNRICHKISNKQKFYFRILNHRKENFDTYIKAAKSTGNYFSDSEISQILDFNKRDKRISFKTENNFNDFLKFDMQTYLQNDILKKTDMTSMYNSIELRAPFLDYELSDFIMSLPPNFKIDKSQTKKFLKDSSREILPSQILKRSKQGFGSPIGSWLKRDDVKDLKHETLNINNKMFDYIDFNASKSYFNQNSYKTWILLVLGLWFNK